MDFTKIRCRWIGVISKINWISVNFFFFFFFYAVEVYLLFWCFHFTNEPPRDKTNKVTAPSEDSDQPGHLPSLIRDFTVHSVGS